MKFLVDECLSPRLAALARERGFGESSHVVWLGLSGIRDWNLVRIALDGDWTLVTRNSFDFRGPPRSPGGKGLYARLELHAGLVCLNGPDGMTRRLQIELFETALAELSVQPDLINQVLEIFAEASETSLVRRYCLPPA